MKPWYDFNHEVVKQKFEGSPTFVMEASLLMKTSNGKEWHPVAIYHSKNPNREKSHKDFILLYSWNGQFFVSGRDWKDVTDEERYQPALLCMKCNAVLHSAARHHFVRCGCENSAFIDGGMDYIRYGAMNMADTKLVTIDVLTGNITNETPRPAKS